MCINLCYYVICNINPDARTVRSYRVFSIFVFSSEISVFYIRNELHRLRHGSVGIICRLAFQRSKRLSERVKNKIFSNSECKSVK